MKSLFDSVQIRDVQLKNRIVVSPMCQYSSEDGFANDWHLVHLGSRAVGGAGLIIVEATAVAPEGRITPDDLGLWKDAHIPNLSRIVNFLHQQGCVAGIQLAHAGRKASHTSPWKGARPLTSEEGAWQTVAPSAIPYKPTDPLPVALTVDDINGVIQDFKASAERAVKAGFKVIEIHAAHGYLLHEFLSPLSNTRTDNYGGSFTNRIRLLIEIVTGLRKVMPEGHSLFVRISATDYTEGGWTLEESISLCKELKSLGVDLIDCSSGGNVHASIAVGPGYQVPFAAEIRKQAGIMTGAVGMINTAALAQEIISEEKADLVLMARQLLRDPYFPLQAAKQLNTDVNWPSQYLRAR